VEMNKWKQLQTELNVVFRNERLLQQAFTHTSYVNENRNAKHNERLEFLGDAVLELAVSQYLFQTYPERPEGELTKMRASIVCEPSLNAFAEELSFSSYILLGRGEDLSGGRHRPALLADVFESFIGALYLDQGLPSVVQFLDNMIFPKLSHVVTVLLSDYKSRLQEHIQQFDKGALQYRLVTEQGPAHDRLFVTEVCLDDQVLGVGKGRTKKESEQQAASQALTLLSK
jgi:ribonuclease-3